MYEFAPLYAYIIAPFYKIFSPDVFYVRVLNILFSILTCWFIYLIGTTLTNRKVGLFACLITCLYKLFVFYSIVPLKESLSVCIFSLTVYLLVAVIKERPLNPPREKSKSKFVRKNDGEAHPSPRKGSPGISSLWEGTLIKIGGLGGAAGLLINIRPNAVVLLPVIPLFILWYAYRNRDTLKKLSLILVLYIVGVSVALSPFTIRNYLVAGKIALTTSQTGFNLYLGNNLRNPDPYYRPVAFASSSPFEQGIQFTIEASRRVGKKLTPEEASDYWTREVLRMAASEPSAFAGKVWQKTLVLFNRFEACDHYDIDFINNFIRFFKFPLISFWFVLPFGLAGMLMSSMRSRKAFALCCIF